MYEVSIFLDKKEGKKKTFLMKTTLYVRSGLFSIAFHLFMVAIHHSCDIPHCVFETKSTYPPINFLLSKLKKL